MIFGVRHHSPAAARLVRELILREKPDAVLIEGPWDFNDRIGELALDHRLPIAIYSSVVLADAGRAGAYHPFCVHSPEWQALRAGFEIGADVRFIDLPWASIAGAREATHRYGDHELRRSNAIPAVCERLGVDDFDAAWDRLVEIDPQLTLDEYLRRVEPLCAELREHVSELDARRERFMAERIRETPGDVLVVCGGFHVEGLRAATEPAEVPPAPEPGDGRVVALTPYSFEALDALTGYEAGMPNPGFYDLAWRDDDPARAALALVVQELRKRGQHVSPADLIGVESTARGLALIRGHARVWRGDLLDGILGALVKDELELGVPHPMLEATYAVLRGGARGKLADGVSRPPFVRDLEAALEEHDLVPAPVPRTVDVQHELERSRLLHRLVVLDLPGFALVDGRWRLREHADFDGAAVEASAYGPTVAEAAAARLLERLAGVERDAGVAAQVLADAALCGVADVAGPLLARVRELVGAATDLAQVVTALRAVLHLFRYEAVLGTAGDPAYGSLLAAIYDRVLWLLGGRPSEDAGVEAIRAVVETFERTGGDRAELTGVLERLRDDEDAAAGVRGAALGALWVLDGASDDELVAGPVQFADPELLGDFLFGLFALAREPVQRRPDLVARIDDVVMAFADGEFLDALPALRRAFSAFTPREKDRLARGLPGGAALDRAAAADPLTLAAMLELESRLRGALERYGIRA